MKIKESNEKISLRPLITVFFAVALVCCVVRTIQMGLYIDPSTGFYTGGKWLTVVLYVLLALACATFCAVSYVSRESASLDPGTLKGKSPGAATLALAIAMFYDCIDNFLSAFSSVSSSNSAYMGALDNNTSTFKILMSAGTLPMAMQSFFALFSGIFLIILAVDFFKGSHKASSHKLLATAPVWWAGARLLCRFVRKISFLQVSDLFLELIMIAFMIMFFMAFAQVSSGIYSDGFRWRIAGLGLSSAIIALTLNVARLIYTFVNSSSMINPQHPFTLVDFIFVFFVLCMVSRMISPETDAEK